MSLLTKNGKLLTADGNAINQKGMTPLEVENLINKKIIDLGKFNSNDQIQSLKDMYTAYLDLAYPNGDKQVDLGNTIFVAEVRYEKVLAVGSMDARLTVYSDRANSIYTLMLDESREIVVEDHSVYNKAEIDSMVGGLTASVTNISNPHINNIETSDNEEANVILEANKYYILNSQVAPKIILELKDYDINETTKYKEYMGEIRVDENNIDIELPNGIRWNGAEGVSINENLLTLESKKTYLFSILNYIGLISSISNPSLEPLSLTINGSLLSWNEVKNAQSYIVVNGTTKEQYETTNTFIDLSTIIVSAGNHTITVIAKNNYYNDSSNNTKYVIGTALTAPIRLVYSNGNLSWDSVENAVGYKVTLFVLDLSGTGNPYRKTIEVSTNLCDVINEFGDLVSEKTYTAYVVAVGDKQLYYDSPSSTQISITI